jgi:hypothetical protein
MQLLVEGKTRDKAIDVSIKALEARLESPEEDECDGSHGVGLFRKLISSAYSSFGEDGEGPKCESDDGEDEDDPFKTQQLRL